MRHSEPIVVVGAGAAGLFAAWRAATLGARVILLEKTDRIGTKILISGGGKCNITHDGPLEDLIKAFRPEEARFIRPACYRLTNRQVVEMLEAKGLKVMTRPDGRVFPLEGTAKDVTRVLREYLEDAGVDLRLGQPVSGIEAEGGVVKGVVVGEALLSSARVILATGGSSYPASGTTGDGFRMAAALGHTVVKPRAALAPMYLEENGVWQAEWSGVALRDVLLKARLSGKEIARWRGDLLFTHRGISGPTALGISRVVAERFAEGPVTLEVDLSPDAPFEKLRDDLVTWQAEHPKRSIEAFVHTLVPQALVGPVLASASVPQDRIAGQLPAKERNRLVETIKAWRIGQVRTVPLEKGEVVAGGVSLDEVDPQTLRSRKVRGLWLCGEVLDVAGPVGGYNLQAAFATGFVAGEDAVRGHIE